MLPTSLVSLLSTLLSWTRYEFAPTPNYTTPKEALRFELRHLHAISPSARVVWSDVSPSTLQSLDIQGHDAFYSAQTRRLKTVRPASRDAFVRARTTRWPTALDWEEEEIEGPDVESRETLLVLAKMTNNAYLEPGEPGWYDLGGNWTVVSPFYTIVPSSSRTHLACRAIRLDGNRTKTDFVVTSSRLRITQQWFYLSRAPQPASLAGAGPRLRRISSMTICCSVAAALELTGRGRRCVVVIEAGGSATKIV